MAYPNCSIDTANDLPKTYTWTVAEKIIIQAFLPIVTLFGNIGNLAFLYTGYRIPRMRTVANMYLFSVAISDMLFLSTACGLYIWNNAVSPVVRTEIYNSALGCWITYTLVFLFYYASLQMVTLVSFERYYAICLPMKHLSFTGKQRTKKQIMVCWVLALALAVLSAFKWGDLKRFTLCVRSIAGEVKIDPPRYYTIKYCEASYGIKGFTVITDGIANILFFAAMFTSCITYARIIAALSKRDATNLQSNQSNTKKDDVRRQVAIMLIVNGIIFFVCQIPVQVLRFHRVTDVVFEVWSLGMVRKSQLIAVGRIFLYTNSAINPYVYIIGSKYYRQAFMEAFGFGKSKGKAVETSMDITAIPTEP